MSVRKLASQAVSSILQQGLYVVVKTLLLNETVEVVTTTIP
jgi:hypothetical protein